MRLLRTPVYYSYLFLLVVYLLISVHFAYAQDQNVGLKKLDQILTDAHDLNDFLAETPHSSEIRERYFKALQEYYGPDKIPRQSYDAVIRQMRTVNKEVPGFGARLWETTNLGHQFNVQVAVKTTGLELKQQNWDRLLSEWKQEMERRSPSYANLTDKQAAEKLNPLLQNAARQMEVFSQNAKNMKPALRAKAAKDFFENTLPLTAGFKEAKAYLMLRTLNLEKNSDLLHSGDADLVISATDEIRSGKGLNAPEGVKIPDVLRASLARTEVPIIEKPPLKVVDGKPEENDLFRVRTRMGNKGTLYAVGSAGNSEYEFAPLPRRFHGVWKGIPLNECVGGNCSSLDSLTPERWATIALKDSRIYNIERDGSYLGFVQCVPLKLGDKVYASVDFGAPILRNKISTKGADGSTETRHFFEVWLEKASKDKPATWDGFIVGSSEAINNAGVVRDVRGSGSYTFGQRLSEPASELKHLDSMGEKIPTVIPREGYAEGYGGNMIADALVPDAGPLTVLDPLGSEKEAYFRAHPDEFITALKKASPEQKLLWLKYVDSHRDSELNKAFQKFLSQPGNQSQLLAKLPSVSKEEANLIIRRLDELGGNKTGLAQAMYKRLVTNNSSEREGLDFLMWLKEQKTSFKGLPEFSKVAEKWVDVFEKEKDGFGKSLPSDFLSLFHGENAPRISPKLYLRLHQMDGGRIDMPLGTMGPSQYSESYKKFEDMKTYVAAMRKQGLLKTQRNRLLTELGEENTEAENLAFNAVLWAPKELLPTPEEFVKLPKEVQVRIISVIDYHGGQGRILRQEDELLKIASQSDNIEARIKALGVRTQYSQYKPTAVEYAKADVLLSQKLKSGEKDLLLRKDGRLASLTLGQKEFSRTTQSFLEIAKTDMAAGERVAKILYQKIASPEVTESFVKDAISFVDKSPTLREKYLKPLSVRMVDPDGLNKGGLKRSPGAETSLSRIRALKRENPALYSEVRTNAVEHWGEARVASALSINHDTRSIEQAGINGLPDEEADLPPKKWTPKLDYRGGKLWQESRHDSILRSLRNRRCG
jgi:hypothetical protein